MRRTCSSRCASERSRRSSFSCSSWSSTRRSTDIGGPPQVPAGGVPHTRPPPPAARAAGPPPRQRRPADVLGGEFLERVHAAVLVERLDAPEERAQALGARRRDVQLVRDLG